MNITKLEIREFVKKYQEATNTHVFSNIIDMIHPESIYRFTDGDFVGLASVKKAFENTWNSIKNEIYSISDLKIITIDSNTASITYDFHWLGVVGGKQKSGIGRGTNILVRNGDKLQFIYEHLSK